LVNARLAVVGELPTLPAEQSREATAASPAPRSRRVYLERWLEVPVHNLEGLRAGDEVKGPTIFESPTTTVVIRQGERAVVTPDGWLDIRMA
jgi:N-methylhydantoinase A/oxoprolinase/acetone carboxylase beta subunit